MNPEQNELKERVFVYGTLRTGGAQEVRMKSAKRLGLGFVSGQMYRVDWYPGVVLGSIGEVVGEVFEVRRNQIPALDDYEGDEYHRLKVEVHGEVSGEAWIWEWDRPVDGLHLVASGDWLKES